MIYGRAMAWGAANNVPGFAIFTASGWWLISSLMFLLVRMGAGGAVAFLRAALFFFRRGSPYKIEGCRKVTFCAMAR